MHGTIDLEQYKPHFIDDLAYHEWVEALKKCCQTPTGPGVPIMQGGAVLGYLYHPDHPMVRPPATVDTLLWEAWTVNKLPPFPKLDVEVPGFYPTTCAEYVVSPRIVFERQNLAKYDEHRRGQRSSSPKETLESLNTCFALWNQQRPFDRQILKDAKNILTIHRSDNEAAYHYPTTFDHGNKEQARASYLADLQAVNACLGLVEALLLLTE